MSETALTEHDEREIRELLALSNAQADTSILSAWIRFSGKLLRALDASRAETEALRAQLREARP